MPFKNCNLMKREIFFHLSANFFALILFPEGAVNCLEQLLRWKNTTFLSE